MRTIKSLFSPLSVILFMSSIVFAVEVGSEMELTRLVNARYSASFRSVDQNVKAQLPKGTKGQVMEVKKFSSGNSGVLLKIKEGDLANELVWVHYSPKSPSLKLYNAEGAGTNSPVAARDASTTRSVPAMRDPASPSVAAPPVLPVPPTATVGGEAARTPTPEPSVEESVPGTVIKANRDLGRLNGRNQPCAECATAAQAPSATGAAQTLQRGIQVSERPDGKLDARVKCDHKGNYGSHTGKFEVIIENNRVTHLDAQIGNGRCRIHSNEFKQVEMPHNNIVLKNAAGCTVTLANYNSNKPGMKDKPTLNFGVVQIGDGPCEQICGDFMSSAFWQVEADPRTQSCK